MIARILILLSGVLILASCQSDSTRRNTADAQIEKRIDELISRMTVEEKIGQTNQLTVYGTTEELCEKIRNGGDPAPCSTSSIPPTSTPCNGPPSNRVVWHSASDRPRRDPRIPHRLSHSARTGRNVRPRTGRTGGPHRSHRGFGRRHPLDLLSDARHLARPALGPRPRNLRRGSLPDGQHGHGLYKRRSGRRRAAEGRSLCQAFAAHSGPEQGRHSFNAQVSEQDLAETYFPAFRRCVQEARVEGVMGGYNCVNGEPACGSHALISDLLREEWGFDGYFVSDCGAVKDFHKGHKVTNTVEESAALAADQRLRPELRARSIPICARLWQWALSPRRT